MVQYERQEAAARMFRVWRGGGKPPAAAARPAAKRGTGFPYASGLLGVGAAALLIIAAPWLMSLAPLVGGLFPARAPLPAVAATLGYATEAAFRSDQGAARSALKTVMAAGPGAQQKWSNPETGNLGLLWVEGWLGGVPGDCRRVVQRMNLHSALWETSSTSCRGTGGWSEELGWESAARPSRGR
jgi:hypothetical protein